MERRRGDCMPGGGRDPQRRTGADCNGLLFPRGLARVAAERRRRQREGAMSTQDLKERYLRLAHEMWDQGRAAVIDETLTADALRVDPDGSAAGREQVRAQHAAFTKALSGLRFEVHDAVAEGDMLM